MDAGMHRLSRLRARAAMLVAFAVAVGGASVVAEHDGRAPVVRPISTTAGQAAPGAVGARQILLTAGPASPFNPVAGDEELTAAKWQKFLDDTVTAALANAQAFSIAAQNVAAVNSPNTAPSAAAQSQIVAGAAAQNQNAATASALAAAAKAQVAARGAAASTPSGNTAAIPAGNVTTAPAPLPPVPAQYQAMVSARVCPTLLATRARIITQFESLIAIYPNRAAQLIAQRDAALATIDAQLARFSCTVPSSGG